MARVRAEQQPASNAPVVMVGLGIAFLLFMAFLNVVRTGNLLSEANLLFAALIFYAGAGALYLGFGVTGTESWVRFASLATWAGLAVNTGAVAHRWYAAGHPPFASVYEMLLSFVWTLAALTLVAERKFGVKVIGTVTMPVAIVGVVLMQLLRTEVRPLVPALQSTWLHVPWNPQEHSEVFIARGARLFVVIPDLGWLILLVLLAVTAPFAIYLYARWKNDQSLFTLANRAVFVSILLQVLALVFFLVRARDSRYGSLDADGLFPTSLAASPFILSGLIGGIFASLLYLLLLWRRADLEKLLPTADALDRITYKTICIAFPLLTLMIAAGAYWANRTWGSYWSWDPKETWAAITWLVYAGYLHMRITRGWRGRRAAYFAILGFAVVMFTFFGVTYLLPGLHAYA